MKNKFDFYEVVEIGASDGSDLAKLVGQRGSVLGMAQDDDTKRWWYSVSLDSTGEVWNISEDDLSSTGEVKERSDFYSGESVKVRVDPETGEGALDS